MSEVDKILNDLEKYSNKINAMMIASGEGEAPQILKLILFKRMGDFSYEQLIRKYSATQLKKANELVDKFIGDSLIVLNEEEAKKRGLIEE